MDLTKEYIKMCDCEEIQKQWTPKYYDIVFNKGGNVGHYKKSSKNQSIWLPRQDQLQEMVETNPVDRLNGWLEETFIPNKNHAHILVSRYNTYEKNWLVFVMKEKHNKTWDGNKWI